MTVTTARAMAVAWALIKNMTAKQPKAPSNDIAQLTLKRGR
jgi:hypothetical protein